MFQGHEEVQYLNSKDKQCLVTHHGKGDRPKGTPTPPYRSGQEQHPTKFILPQGKNPRKNRKGGIFLSRTECGYKDVSADAVPKRRGPCASEP